MFQSKAVITRHVTLPLVLLLKYTVHDVRMITVNVVLGIIAYFNDGSKDMSKIHKFRWNLNLKNRKIFFRIFIQ